MSKKGMSSVVLPKEPNEQDKDSGIITYRFAGFLLFLMPLLALLENNVTDNMLQLGMLIAVINSKKETIDRVNH